MLLERAGAKGRKHYREPLTEAQAARLIEVCAEYAGSRYMGWVPGDDLSYYGHPVMRRKRPRKGVVGKR